MSSRSLSVVVALAVLLVSCGGALAQQGPVRGPIEAPRDAEKEVFAKHNLEVARYYVTRRKAYEGALDRLKEIVDAYPEFSRLDEVVYWMGEANLKLDKRDTAVEFYEKLLKDFPGSEFAKKAKTRLDELKAVEKPKP